MHLRKHYCLSQSEVSGHLKSSNIKMKLKHNYKTIFEIGGEGGSISISRHADENSVKYIYSHNELDPTDEGLAVHKMDEYDSFEEPFQIINNKYSWYNLFVQTIHEDYREYIIRNLIYKLNMKKISPDYFHWSKSRLEKTLRIKLTYDIDEKNELVWNFHDSLIDD